MVNIDFSASNDLKKLVSQTKFKRIFFLCGKKSYYSSGANQTFKKILKKKTTKFYFKNSPFPEIVELRKITLSLKKFSPDLIIAVGGGSVMDYAKIANSIDIEKNLEKKIVTDSYTLKQKLAKLIAIPTTAGSGAEVTDNAVIYINKIKYSVESELIKPDYFFLIPEFVMGAPKKIKSSAGFDAIAQAVESLISKKSNLTSIRFAKKSLKILLKYYLDFLSKPTKENTSAMCLAANLSGKAINISKTTIPHAISYPFTSFYNINHGHAVSLTLEKFMKFNYVNYNKSDCNFNLKSRYEDIFSIFKVTNINDFENFIINLKKKTNLECDFAKLKIDLSNDVDRIIQGVNLLRLRNNPINLKKSDIKTILLKK